MVRPLWKIILAALVDTSDSDSESGVEQAGFPVVKCQHENESDVTLMERRIMTQSRTMNIINAEVGMAGITSSPARPLTGMIPQRGGLLKFTNG